MPQPVARPGIQSDDAVREEVVSAMADANEIILGRSGGYEGDAALFVQRHAAPAIRGIALGLVPGVVAKLARLRHRVECPAMLTGDDVEAPNVFGDTGDNDRALEDRRSSRGCAKVAMRLSRQQRLPALAEPGDGLAAAGIERIEKSAGTEHHSFPCPVAAGPVNQPAKGGPAVGLEAP